MAKEGIIWNDNDEERRDLTKEEKSGIEKLREKYGPDYADFVQRSIPRIDSSRRFVEKTMKEAREKLRRNREIINKNNKAKANDKKGNSGPLMIYDEKTANGLINEGVGILSELGSDATALRQAIATGEKTINRANFITAAAHVPLVPYNKNRDRDNNNKRGNQNQNQSGNKADSFMFRQEEQSPVKDKIKDILGKKAKLNETTPGDNNPKVSKMQSLRGIGDHKSRIDDAFVPKAPQQRNIDVAKLAHQRKIAEI